MNKKKDEPLWCKIYRDEIIKPAQLKRKTEQQGRTEASRAGFYNTPTWKRIRDRRRRENPLCQRCESKGFYTPGKVVNHIKPVEDYPELATDYDNTEHLCNSCNDWATKQDAKERRKRKRLEKGRTIMKQLEKKYTPPGG